MDEADLLCRTHQMPNCSGGIMVPEGLSRVTSVEVNYTSSLSEATSAEIGGANGGRAAGNSLTEGGSDTLFLPETSLCLLIAYTFVFSCCFFGNMLVILVVCLNRRMRTTTNFFLVNLAIADLCVGTFCVYQNISLYLMEKWIFGNFLCKMYHFVHGMSYTASILILTVISVERYLAICHPMWSKRVITLNRLRIVVCLVWLIAAAYSSPKLIIYGVIRYDLEDQPGELCVIRRELKSYHRMHKIYDLINFIVCFVVPLLVISVLYTFICMRLWKSQDMLRPATKRPQDERTSPTSVAPLAAAAAAATAPAATAATATASAGQTAPVAGCSQVTLSITPDMQYHLTQSRSAAQQQQQQQPAKQPKCERVGYKTNDPTVGASAGQLLSSSSSSAPPELPLVQQEVRAGGQTQVVVQGPPVSSSSSSSYFRCCPAGFSMRRYCCCRCRRGRSRGRGQSRTEYQSGSSSDIERGRASCGGSSCRSTASSAVLRARRNVIRLLVVVLLCFAVCNLPFHARKLYQNWAPSYDGTRLPYVVLTMVTHLILYLNSGINPFIYALFSRNFRQCMRDVLLCSTPGGFTKGPTTGTQLAAFSTNGHPLQQTQQQQQQQQQQAESPHLKQATDQQHQQEFESPPSLSHRHRQAGGSRIVASSSQRSYRTQHINTSQIV